jgi:hypothetical protein
MRSLMLVGRSSSRSIVAGWRRGGSFGAVSRFGGSLAPPREECCRKTPADFRWNPGRTRRADRGGPRQQEVRTPGEDSPTHALRLEASVCRATHGGFQHELTPEAVTPLLQDGVHCHSARRSGGPEKCVPQAHLDLLRPDIRLVADGVIKVGGVFHDNSGPIPDGRPSFGIYPKKWKV